MGYNGEKNQDNLNWGNFLESFNMYISVEALDFNYKNNNN